MAAEKTKERSKVKTGTNTGAGNSVKARPPSDVKRDSRSRTSQTGKKSTAKKKSVSEKGKKQAGIKNGQAPAGKQGKPTEKTGKAKKTSSKKDTKKLHKTERDRRKANRLELERQLAQENSQAYENLIRRRNAWKRKRRKQAYVLLGIILSAAGIYLCCRMFLTIATITVTGQSRYTDEDLISSSGLEIGSNLFDFDAEQVGKTILDGHIYLETVTVKRSLPTTVEIAVTPVLETGVVRGEMGFSVISTGGKVLETGIPYPPSELPIISGLQLNISRSDNEALANIMDKRLETLSEINRALTENKITGITAIDLSDSMNLTITYQNRVKINLGNREKINDKIRFSMNVLEEVDPSQEGVLNLSIDKKGFFRAESIYGDLSLTPAASSSQPEQGAQEPESDSPENSPDTSSSSSAGTSEGG